MARVNDLTGKVFGEWFVLGRDGSMYGKSAWLCRCTCGNESRVCSTALTKTKGGSKSCGCKNKLPKGEAAFNHLFNNYRMAAERRDYIFDLSVGEFRALVTSNCHYCGVEPCREYDRDRTNGSFTYNGVDRVDNSVGYKLENVVPCCAICNHAKRDMSLRDFLNWVDRISRHRSINETAV